MKAPAAAAAASAAYLVISLKSIPVMGQPLQGRQVNICQDVATKDGCIASSAFNTSIFFTCENGLQTLFTCDGGCNQNNAANLPTCNNGKLFTGQID